MNRDDLERPVKRSENCELCRQPWPGLWHSCPASASVPQDADTKRALLEAVAEAATSHVLAQRRLFDAMKRPTDPYWDVRVTDAVQARDAARVAVEVAVDALQAHREARNG